MPFVAPRQAPPPRHAPEEAGSTGCEVLVASTGREPLAEEAEPTGFESPAAKAAGRVLRKAAETCNPREMFSMLMEGLVHPPPCFFADNVHLFAWCIYLSGTKSILPGPSICLVQILSGAEE